MRKAALAAGTVQLLYLMFMIAPQIFGMSFSSSPGQTALRIVTLAACLVLANFFFWIVISPAPNIGRAVRIASVVAATALTVENFQYTYRQIRGITTAASESGLWKYHPLRQFTHVLGLTIPTLAEITMAVFLLVVFFRSQRAQGRKQGVADRTLFLKVASLMVAAVFTIALVATAFSANLGSGPHPVSVVRFLLRFTTLASFIAFFVAFGINQRQEQA